MRKSRLGMAAALLAVAITAARAGADGSANSGASMPGKSDKAPLGSKDFYPSAERPIGLRGDWTGRFPGANPPASWIRRVKCLAYELGCQAKKPGASDRGKPISEKFPYRFRTVAEWLVIGPFKPSDPEKGLDEQFVPNEASLEPNEGEKVGNLTWTSWAAKPWIKTGWYRTTPPSSKESIVPTFDDVLRAGKEFLTEKYKGKEWTWDKTPMPEPEIGFQELFPDCKTEPCGNITDKIAAYAFTWLYAPADGSISLALEKHCDTRIWVNGKVVLDAKHAGNPMGCSVDKVELKKGWNRLLVKLNNHGKVLRFDLKLWPSAENSSYEVKNIKWALPMTAGCPGTPLVVGDKLFVSTDFHEIFSVNKKDGKVLWMRMSHPYYSLSAEDKKAHPEYTEKVKPLMDKVEALNEDVVKEMNALIAANPPSSPVQTKNLARLKGQRNKIWEEAWKVMQEADKERFKPTGGPYGVSESAGAAGYTPCSDGQFVYDFYFATCIASCYDLDGNRKWSSGIDPVYRHSTHHGYNAAPALGKDKLAVYNAGLTVFDKKTGAKAWQGKHTTGIVYASPIIMRLGDAEIITSPHLDGIMRLSDGQVLWEGKAFLQYAASAVIIDGIAYCTGTQDNRGPYGVRMPATLNGMAKGPQIAVRFSRMASGVAGQLYHDGLLYSVDNNSRLFVGDGTTGEPVYVETLDLRPFQHGKGGGLYCCIVLGGKYIYITDNEGATVVITPGRKYEVVGRNLLDALGTRGGGVDVDEGTGAAGGGAIFDGTRVYFRGGRNLYCIEEENASKTAR